MMRIARPAHKLLGFILFTALISARPGFSDEQRKTQLVELLINQWFSRDPVEFTEIERFSTTNAIESQVAFDTKGRLTMRCFDDNSQENPTPPVHFIQDGKLIHGISYFCFEPHNVLIDQISISGQVNTAGAYPNRMTSLLWLLMPGGRPPYNHVANSKSIEMEEDSVSKHSLVRVESEHKHSRIFIYLDPELQFAVRKVKTIDSSYLWEALEFKQIDGFWFPVRGRDHSPRDTGNSAREYRREFTVTDIAVNKPLRYSSFSAPEPTEGALVTDATKRTSRLIGKAETREQLQKKYSRPNRAPPADSSYEPENSGYTYATTIPELLALLSLCVILISLCLRRRDRQSRNRGQACTLSP
jgi:hypothetical protein